MGEIETTEQDKDGSDKTGEEGTDTSKNNDGADDSAKEGANADEKTDDEEPTDDEEEGAKDDGKDKEDDKKSPKTASKEDDEKEPPTRKSKLDFIRQRLDKKAEKKGDKAKEEGAEDGEDIDPADEETIGKVIDKRLKPLTEKLIADEDEAEIGNFLKDNPDFKPFEAKARKYMAHPSRKDVPIEEIFYGVAGKDLMAIGARRAKIADDEAKKTKTGGGAADAGGVKGAAQMTAAELEAKQAEVRAKLADRY